MATTNTTNTTNNATTNTTNTAHAPHRPGAFIWLEVRTKDVAKTARIFSEVAGWKISTMAMGPGGDYTLASTQHGPIAGVVPLEEGQRAGTVTYVSVDDVDAALSRVTKAGGKASAAFDVPGIGRMAEVHDPEGAALFVMKSATGDAELPRAQGSVHWNELWSREPKKAVAFYTSVFGYAVEAMPMGGAPYHVLSASGASAGGIMAVPAADVAPQFVQYLVVDDVEAALARAKKHGCAVEGKPGQEVQEVDGIGRFAFVRTDEGVRVGLMTPAA